LPLIDYALWLVGRRREKGRLRIIESEDEEDEVKDEMGEEKEKDEKRDDDDDGSVFA